MRTKFFISGTFCAKRGPCKTGSSLNIQQFGTGPGIVFGPSGMRVEPVRVGMAAGGVDYAAVSAAIKRFERRLAREHSLGKIVRLEMLNVET